MAKDLWKKPKQSKKGKTEQGVKGNPSTFDGFMNSVMGA